MSGPIPESNAETAGLFARNFEKLVFESENELSWWWVNKWSSLIRIDENIAPEVRKSFVAASETLAKITGLSISFGVAANVFIKHGHGESFGQSDGYHCFVHLANRPDGSMDSASIYIGHNITGNNLGACITEELSQALGPINDTALVEHSLWRPKTRQFFFSDEPKGNLTWHDAIILRVLYNERIKPGMHKRDAMPIVRELIAKELRDLNS